MGDAGVGKTRLVRELWELARPQSRPSRCAGRAAASRYGRGCTYRPLADVLREELGLLETDSPELVRRRLGDRDVLGARRSGSTSQPTSTRSRRASELAARRGSTCSSELAAERPVGRAGRGPALGARAAARPARAAAATVRGRAAPRLARRGPSSTSSGRPGGGGRDATTIWLEPLSDEEADGCSTLLGDDGSRRSCASRVARAGRGEPVLPRGAARGPSRRLARPRESPDSVHGVLAARIDLLPPTEKAALQAASVIGRVFWRGAVRELLERRRPTSGCSRRATSSGAAPASSLAGEREFVFKHALTRDVAYASLSEGGARARLHAAFADWLERHRGGPRRARGAARPPLRRGGAAEDADLAWRRRASVARLRGHAPSSGLAARPTCAIARYELDEAIALLERALASRTPSPRRRALAHDRACERARTTATRSSRRCDAIELTADETTGRALRRARLGDVVRAGMWRRRPAPSRRRLDRAALELALPDSAARARALIARLLEAGRNPAYAREASASPSVLDDVELRWHAWVVHGITEFVSGRYDHGRAFAERRFELLDWISDPDHRADIYWADLGLHLGGAFQRGPPARPTTRRDHRSSDTAPPPPRGRDSGRGRGAAGCLGADSGAGAEDGDEAVAANAATPCVRNARSLLVCAAASAYLGDETDARRQRKEYGGPRDRGLRRRPRHSAAAARAHPRRPRRRRSAPRNAAPHTRLVPGLDGPRDNGRLRLDGLAAIRGAERAEAEARRHLRPNTYLEPFALRTLGVVREEEELVRLAKDPVHGLGLEWHAAPDSGAALGGLSPRRRGSSGRASSRRRAGARHGRPRPPRRCCSPPPSAARCSPSGLSNVAFRR